MPSIGPRCHELRIRDRDANWRIVYRNDSDAIVVVEIFAKKTNKTPVDLVKNCRLRLKRYDSIG